MIGYDGSIGHDDGGALAPGSVIAVTAEDDRFEYARRAAMQLASDEDLTLVLYDMDAASLLNEPLPSGWSAEGAGEQFGDRLTADDLRRLGRAPMAGQVEEAQAAGVDAYGWLPTSHGPDPLAEYADQQRARFIVMPAEHEELDPVTALLAGTRRPINHLAEEARARVVVAHPDGRTERR